MIYISAKESDAIERAATLLKEGLLVAFPTDTLYGVGADAFNADAIGRLYAAKGRAADKGIPILLAHAADLPRVVDHIPAVALPLIERYWPGPLTLILPKHKALPSRLSPNDGIAVRIPDHPLTRDLIAAAGGALATSSANQAGETPTTQAAAAAAALENSIAAVLDGGPVTHGLASTIVDCRQPRPVILRAGPITLDDLVEKESS